jgi:mono/diheme cytochrome c family protein
VRKLLAFAAAVAASLEVAAQARKPSEWLAPKEARAQANPVATSEDALRKGRALYQRHCALCHGDKGRGDGTAARMHADRSSHTVQDLTDPKVQASMSDGEIFWKISTGLREDGKIVMPAYTEEIPKDEDRWKLVHYVRSLAAR